MPSHNKKKKIKSITLIILILSFFLFIIITFLPKTSSWSQSEEVMKTGNEFVTPIMDKVIETVTPKQKLDVEEYNRRVLALAHKSIEQETIKKTETPSDVNIIRNELSISLDAAENATSNTDSSYENSPWPPEAPLPLYGAILPFKRIVAYYGNLYSKQMGALGEYPEDIMLGMLDDEVKNWEEADPTTPVQPALHYIASTAQSSPGEEGLYTLRMPDSEIDKVIAMAEKSNSILFLDLQIGLSSIQKELPYIEKYLKMPQVHLGLDPEFSMKGGEKPGSVIGTMDANDINYAANYLSNLVRENNLPPKILIIHRFTNKMVTNYQNIKPLPEVQIVIEMDGWGPKALKINTYNQTIYPEPVQFAGIKIFYKNDIKGGGDIMSPQEVLDLNPKPIYIQYQ